MTSVESVQCPFCGQTTDIELEYDAQPQSFVTDCEVCCRPMEIRVSCVGGETPELSVVSAG
jgi:hypothetical protein